jgi:hypothetical protein
MVIKTMPLLLNFAATSHAVDVAFISGTSRAGDVPESKELIKFINQL